MSNEKCNCSETTQAEMVVLTCSGACDLGEIADKLARKLRDNKVRNMKCLAMVGADSPALIEGLKVSNLLVIDGCPVDCGKKIVEKAGISDFQYARLTDFGYEKGKTPATTETIDTIYEKVECLC